MVVLLALAACVWVGLLVAAPFLPAPAAALLYALGSYICHQRPERSFHLAGAQLPVCARCFGVYIGAAMGAIAATRLRPVRFPRVLIAPSLAPALISLVAEWGGAWLPSNIARSLTGLLAGAIVAGVVLATLHYEQCAQRRPNAPNRRPTPI